MYMAEEETPTNRLQYFRVKGYLVLQQLWLIRRNFNDHSEEWRDVPIFEKEEVKTQPEQKKVVDEVAFAAKLREHLYDYPGRPKQTPRPGDIVEINGVLGVCTHENIMGHCFVRGLDLEKDQEIYMDFIIDETKHGPSSVTWKIRHDLYIGRSAVCQKLNSK